MKALLLLSAFVSTASFAQTLDVNGLKSLLTQRQSTLEKVTVGMTKQLVTTAQVKAASGVCKYTLTSLQTIVRLENNSKMIVLAQESLKTDGSKACTEAQVENFTEKVLFFEDKPSLANDLADLDAGAADIISITKKGEEVLMTINATNTNTDGTTTKEKLDIVYDLTQSAFRNIKSTTAAEFKMVTTIAADVNVMSLDLKDVLFCDSADDKGSCVRGDFSDVLY